MGIWWGFGGGVGGALVGDSGDLDVISGLVLWLWGLLFGCCLLFACFSVVFGCGGCLVGVWGLGCGVWFFGLFARGFVVCAV